MCGDKTRVSYSRPIRAAARDEARLDAVRRQLAAMLRANERAHFLSLCELASAELRLAHAVDCIDVSSLDDGGRIALLNCLFNLLSEGQLAHVYVHHYCRRSLPCHHPCARHAV